MGLSALETAGVLPGAPSADVAQNAATDPDHDAFKWGATLDSPGHPY